VCEGSVTKSACHQSVACVREGGVTKSAYHQSVWVPWRCLAAPDSARAPTRSTVQAPWCCLWCHQDRLARGRPGVVSGVAKIAQRVGAQRVGALALSCASWQATGREIAPERVGTLLLSSEIHQARPGRALFSPLSLCSLIHTHSHLSLTPDFRQLRLFPALTSLSYALTHLFFRLPSPFSCFTPFPPTHSPATNPPPPSLPATRPQKDPVTSTSHVCVIPFSRSLAPSLPCLLPV
jgi:hypothetical protein